MAATVHMYQCMLTVTILHQHIPHQLPHNQQQQQQHHQHLLIVVLQPHSLRLQQVTQTRPKIHHRLQLEDHKELLKVSCTVLLACIYTVHIL
jgi:biopolymer transport protein ExbD